MSPATSSAMPAILGAGVIAPATGRGLVLHVAQLFNHMLHPDWLRGLSVE
jgi:hypothetical protein